MLRKLLLGLGTLLMIIALVLLVLNNFGMESNVISDFGTGSEQVVELEEEVIEEEFTDLEIINQARELGMEFPEQLEANWLIEEAQGLGMEFVEEMDKEELQRQAQELGMRFPENIEEDLLISQARELGMDFPEEISEEEIINKAQNLGMEFEENIESEIITIELTELEVEPFFKMGSGINLELISDIEEQLEVVESMVEIEIEEGWTASMTVISLYEAGIIEEPNTLLYLIRHLGASTKIRAGKYQFSPNTSAVEILLKMIGG